MKKYCFYHSGDFDGKCSAAIFKLKYSDVILYGIDYGEEFPFDVIKKEDIVFMVDFSLAKEDILKLNKMCTFVWIDHHISAINDKEFFGILGLRDHNYAACQLVWKYLFNTEPVPKAVNLIGNYDIWNHRDPDVLPFQMGLKTYDFDPEKDFKQWKKLFLTPYYLNPFAYYKKFIKIGKSIIKYQEFINKQMVKNAHEVDFEGYKCIALNTAYSNSFVFNSIPNVYAVKILYYNNGKFWRYTLYSDEKHGINVSKIAKKYNGGGHFYAAGFYVNRLLF
jgi:oligoribonuclease NrnB/cAMP/cGMP phosphodiesterase (DHH superfamily)